MHNSFHKKHLTHLVLKNGQESYYKAKKASRNHVYSYEWVLVNNGEIPLRIDSVINSCDCIELLYDSVEKVNPKSDFRVIMRVHPEGIIGPFFREVMLYGNFQSSPLVLSLEGEYLP